MQETWIWFLGWEDTLEEGMATDSSILTWRNPMDRGAWQATVHRVMTQQQYVPFIKSIILKSVSL